MKQQVAGIASGHKAKVQDNLLDEQYGLCCYSELRADLEGLGYHIEHLRPKSHYPALTFDYTNLAASALSNDDLKTLLRKKHLVVMPNSVSLIQLYSFHATTRIAPDISPICQMAGSFPEII